MFLRNPNIMVLHETIDNNEIVPELIANAFVEKVS